MRFPSIIGLSTMLALASMAHADELKATITEVSDNTVQLKLVGETLPLEGDPVEIYDLLAGGTIEARVAQGNVKSIGRDGTITVTITSKTSPILSRYKARIVVDSVARRRSDSATDGNATPDSTDARPRQMRPGAGAADFQQGQAQMKEKNWDAAATAFQKAIRLEPDNPSYHDQLGEALYGLRRWAESERAYERALRLKPDFGDCWNRLGVVRVKRSDHEGAVAAYEEAIKQSPDEPLFLTNYGKTLRDLGRFDEAIEITLRAIELEPNKGWHKESLGTIYHDQKDWPRAEAAYRDAARLTPRRALLHNELGTVQYYQQKYEEAIQSYREAIRLDPRKGAYHANLAGALFKAGEERDAIEAAERAIDLGFEKHWVYGRLGLTPHSASPGEPNEITTLDAPDAESPGLPTPVPFPRSEPE